MSLRNNVLKVYRNKGGTFVDGYWDAGKEYVLQMRCSIQPFDPKEISFIPENRRTSDRVNIFTDAKLFVSSDEQPDQVEHDGGRWEVFKCFSWQNKVIDHYRYILIRLENK